MKKIILQFLYYFIATVVSVENENQFSLGNGVNLQPSYYNNGDVNFGWATMKKYSKIKTVRIEIEPDKVNQAKDWIAAAHKNGYQIIATYHKCSVLGTDDSDELQKGANWWVKNYKTLISSGASITINLMNEWGSHSQTSTSFAEAYNKAIVTVRTVYSGPIVVDVPGWGQETATAAAAVKGQGNVTLKDSNIVLSVHAYPNGWNSGKNHELQAIDLDDLASAGRPCIIGEFGYGDGAGPVDVPEIVSHAKALGWPVFGWAWNGDGGSVMNMVTPSWAKNATATSFSPSKYFNTVYDLI